MAAASVRAARLWTCAAVGVLTLTFPLLATGLEAPADTSTRMSNAALGRALGALDALHGADLVVVDQPGPGQAPSALLATRVQAAPAALAATLCDPRAYRQAIPSLIRADVIQRRRVPGTAAQQLLLQWELEIPLFNLKGKAWVRPRPDGVDLILIEGDLAPGRLSFTWAAASDIASAGRAGAAGTGASTAISAGTTGQRAPATPAAETILVLESQANVRAAGWLFRRVASRSPFGESAMNLTAAYVVLRAAAEHAQHPTDAAARRPRAPPAPPAPGALIADAHALAGDGALTEFRRRGVIALVRRGPSGRLAAVAVAVPVTSAPSSLLARLAAPEGWSAFPGWHRVKPLAGDRVQIDDNLPFVDFDAVWQLRRDRLLGFSAGVVDGATQGALAAWDVERAPDPGFAGSAGSATLAVLTLYPRLETAGYIPRKFITAEPLLEHGMTLALAYVDAMSVRRALDGAAPAQGTQNPAR